MMIWISQICLTESRCVIIAVKFIEEFIKPSKIHEQIFVGYLWRTPQMYEKFKKHKITKDTFTESIWHFYYHIGSMMFDKGIRTFDEVTVYSFLASQPKEKNKKSLFDYYDGFKGYDTVKNIIEECDKQKENEEYHLSEIQKFEALRKLQSEHLINTGNKELVQKLVKANLKQIQLFFQHKNNELFSHINSGEVIEHNLIDDLDETIDKLNKGESMGLPLHNAPRLNKKIKGSKNGTLMYLVLSSGMGKTSWGTEKKIISLIENNEKGMVFANEEGVFKWRTLLLATVASTILHTPINREKLANGKFDDRTMEKLNNAKNWLYTHRRDMIKFFELKKYRIEDVINRINLYRPLGYGHVFFDTFKPDLSRGGEMARWEAFSNSAQELYDCIKEDANNVATLATVQLKIGKEYRFLDLGSIGKSLEIVEVAGVVLIGRMLYSDEYKGERHEVSPYNWEQKDGKWIKEPYELDPTKKYMILFIAKNREGSVDEQIIYEVNYDINSWREVAFVVIPKESVVF